MPKVLIIGIDGMDSIVLSKFEAELPNLAKLKVDSPKINLTSVQPPDSDTAWASIFTGLNPAKHGIVHFVDPLDKAHILATETKDNSILRGNTFWDVAGKFGKKVCILFPHLGYPIWPVNGVMIGRSADDVQTFPEQIADVHSLSQLRLTASGFPGKVKDLGKFIESHRRLVLDEAEFGLMMLRKYDCDLFLIYSSSLDIVQHFLWKFCDEDDPSYPGDNPYKEAIKEFYQLYDEIVGRFMALVDPETVVIVVSDHGHGMRPTKLVNLNELLREKGLLVTKAGNPLGKTQVYLMERLKRNLLIFASKYELGGAAQKLMRVFPRVRKIYTSPLSIDWQKTIACVSDLSGIKAYSYGGIIIKQDKIQGKEYEELRSSLIRELSEIRDPQTGEALMNWICQREELYSGPYISKYPDIIFDLKEEYGAGWAMDSSLVGPSYSHSFVPGSHKAYSTVFIMGNLKGKEIIKEHMTLMDIAPTVLDLFGIGDDFGFDGEGIFVKPNVGQ